MFGGLLWPKCLAPPAPASRFYRLWHRPSLPPNLRVLPSRGVEDPRLGLGHGALHEALRGSRLEAIVHCAAWVSGVHPYEALMAANVRGADVEFG